MLLKSLRQRVRVALAQIKDPARREASTPLFRPPVSSRGQGKDGFRVNKLSVRAVEYLVERYACELGLDPAVSVHSLRVTALTTARERGSDVIDLQDFA